MYQGTLPPLQKSNSSFMIAILLKFETEHFHIYVKIYGLQKLISLEKKMFRNMKKLLVKKKIYFQLLQEKL